MPGFDGTGPRGLGPLTGGGRGLCLPGVSRVQEQVQPTPVQPVSGPEAVPAYENAIRGTGFIRQRGFGRGRGMRGGRGRGRQR